MEDMAIGIQICILTLTSDGCHANSRYPKRWWSPGSGTGAALGIWTRLGTGKTYHHLLPVLHPLLQRGAAQIDELHGEVTMVNGQWAPLHITRGFNNTGADDTRNRWSEESTIEISCQNRNVSRVNSYFCVWPDSEQKSKTISPWSYWTDCALHSDRNKSKYKSGMKQWNSFTTEVVIKYGFKMLWGTV